MGYDWLKFDRDTPNHWKSMELEQILGIEEAWAKVARLWCWAASSRPNGDLSGLSDEVIARAANWRGDAKIFVEALIKVRFLDADRTLHNWSARQEAHVSKAEKKRAAATERKRRQRERERAEKEAAEKEEGARGGDVTPDVTRDKGVTLLSPLLSSDLKEGVQGEERDSVTPGGVTPVSHPGLRANDPIFFADRGELVRVDPEPDLPAEPTLEAIEQGVYDCPEGHDPEHWGQQLATTYWRVGEALWRLYAERAGPPLDPTAYQPRRTEYDEAVRKNHRKPSYLLRAVKAASKDKRYLGRAAFSPNFKALGPLWGWRKALSEPETAIAECETQKRDVTRDAQLQRAIQDYERRANAPLMD